MTDFHGKRKGDRLEAKMAGAEIIDGREVARQIRSKCRERVEKLKQQFNVTPGLAVIIVGHDPASAVYVRNKVAACADVGIHSLKFVFEADTEIETLIKT